MQNSIYFAKVMHKRLFPKEHSFNYGGYYLHLPLSKLSELRALSKIKLNRRGLLSFWEKDHGAHTANNLEVWARSLLEKHTINKADGEIVLVTFPRVLGYVFNPVSFYFCFDKTQNLRAVIAEVNNTFGETHNYICVNNNQEIIAPEHWLEAEKIFHVSPFLEREGTYKFRFDYKPNNIGIWIDLYDPNQNKKLITSLLGKLEPMTDDVIAKAFWKHPLVTFKTIILIHIHALKLVSKGLKYIVKPQQRKENVTVSVLEQNN